AAAVPVGFWRREATHRHGAESALLATKDRTRTLAAANARLAARNARLRTENTTLHARTASLERRLAGSRAGLAQAHDEAVQRQSALDRVVSENADLLAAVGQLQQQSDALGSDASTVTGVAGRLDSALSSLAD